MQQLQGDGLAFIHAGAAPSLARIVTASGRRLMSTACPASRPTPPIRQRSPESRRTTAMSGPTSSTMPWRRFVVPMKSATNRVDGRS